MDFTQMSNTTFSVLLVVGVLGACAGTYASGQTANPDAARKLRGIVIQDAKLEGSPKEIVEQLNGLTKKYDLPTHEGLTIRFDSAVDSKCCGMSIFRGGEPLSNWLQA